MRILATLAASCLLTLCALEANASVVNFLGTITAGGGGSAVLGTIPPLAPRTFALTVNFNDGAGFTPFLGTATGGSFVVASPTTNFNVTGGNIFVAEGGANDSATFIIDVAGPATGQLIFTFNANAIADNNANQANIDALTTGNSTTFVADFTASGGGAYTGKISSVPEPSSCLALLGLVGGGAWRWRRSRQQQNAV